LLTATGADCTNRVEGVACIAFFVVLTALALQALAQVLAQAAAVAQALAAQAMELLAVAMVSAKGQR